MNLDHISVTLNEESEECCYKIRAELKGIPGKQWHDGLRFVWYNSSYYLCKKSELIMEGNEIELLLEDSCDLQNAIDTLSSSILKADKIARSTSITNISSYKRAMN